MTENGRSRYAFLISLILMCFLTQGVAQISPGELTKSHAQLEGILNCTKCHVLGDKVSNEKCLECHKDIKARIDNKKGYHASSEVTGKDCFTCHSDHHGRNFEIIRFDTDRFNHQLTGYKLTGAHVKLDCAACHKDEFVESAELKKKETTYLGLKTTCVSCHKDVHQNTLSKNDCASCHNTEAFVPAALFDHAKTAFPLKGQHKEVDCKSCHEITYTNNALLQRFAGVPFNSCASCHEDVHNNKFGTNCKECHTEESFNVFVGSSTFNHSKTNFPLKGKHKKVGCASCHNMDESTSGENVFQDYKNKETGNCITCHKDVHEAKFGTECKVCHTEESFLQLLNPDAFNHSLTGYALEGKHEKVDCRKCHETTKMTDPLPHNQCADCHSDFHKGQFVRNTYSPDCKECHSVKGFVGSYYTIEKHNEGTFPLTGAHAATPCIACHKKAEEWTFRQIGQKCADCHTDIHEGFLDVKYYPEKQCNQCHTPDSWSQIDFDHQRTSFTLEGRHETIDCRSCHKPDTNNPADKTIPFAGLKQECLSCHPNIHGEQFQKDGITDCSRCHTNEAWKPSTFDHNTARFVLDGAHKKVACKDCHKPEMIENVAVIQYRLNDFECATCHNN